MGKRREMHGLLLKMIDRAEAGDLRGVEDLKKTYDGLAKDVYSDPRSDMDLSYDQCATGLLKSLESPELRHLFTDSLRQIYSKLPVPGDNE